MEVEYELTPEDLKAFQAYHKKHPIVPPKKGLQAILFGLVWFGVLIVGVAGYHLATVYYVPLLSESTAMVPGVGVGAILALVGLTLYARLIQSNLTRKALQEGRNAEKSLGWRRLAIDPHAIRTTSAFSSSSFFWEGVDAVGATDDYAFLYISTRMAHVIPRRAFPDDRAFDDFVEMARRYQRMGGIAKDGQRVPEEARRVQPPPVPCDERLTGNREPG